MIRLPRFILVVACMHPKMHKDASDILAEYLKGLPYLKKKCYGEYSNTDFYIISNTAGFHKLLDNLITTGTYSILSYRVYSRMVGNSNVVYLKYPYASSYNSFKMPSSIHIPTDDIEHFITITKS